MKCSILFLCSLLIGGEVVGVVSALPKKHSLVRPSLFGLHHHSASSSFAVKKDINRNAKSDSNNLVTSSAALSYRGGACSDSTLSILSKVGLGTIVEAILLFATTQFAASAETLLNFDQLSLIRFVQVIELLCVIFGSSQFGAIVDSGLSAATKQFLDPNTIPVSIF